MNYLTQETEISLKDMIFYTVYRWKKILVIALIFALLLGGFQGILSFMTLNDAESLKEIQAEYEDDLRYYESKLEELKSNVDSLKIARDSQRTYLNNSVLMNIDPSNVAQAKASLYIDTNYQIIPNATYQNPDKTASIKHAYELAVYSNALLDEISATTNLDPKYIKELITTIPAEEIQLPTTTLDISVVHSSPEEASAIMNQILSYLTSLKPSIIASIDNHKAEVLSNSVSIMVDNNLSELQTTAKKALTALENELSSTENTLASFAAPEKGILSTSDAVKNIVIWTIVGAVVGGFLGVFFFLAMYLFSGKVYSAKELQIRYNLSDLGHIAASDKKADFLTRFLKKSEQRIIANSEGNYAVIAANLETYSKSMKNILLTGSIDSAELMELTKRLQGTCKNINLICDGSILTDAAAVHQLADCDGVVLLEKCGTSLYNEVILELNRINDFKKPVIGCLVIE